MPDFQCWVIWQVGFNWLLLGHVSPIRGELATDCVPVSGIVLRTDLGQSYWVSWVLLLLVDVAAKLVVWHFVPHGAKTRVEFPYAHYLLDR